jgi:DNA-binding transcriptional MerR regulator
MSATAGSCLRIGDVAKAAGTTPRTVRYYEELGLLRPDAARLAGEHRSYTEADVERLSHILRLKDLLGVSLEELGELVAAEDARLARKEEFHAGPPPERERVILREALADIDRQLALVARRSGELARLRSELDQRRARVCDLLGVNE